LKAFKSSQGSLRYRLQFLFTVTESHSINERRQLASFLLCALVIATQKLRKLLMIVEDQVGILVLARHRIRPELLHEEHLICELGTSAVTRGTRLLDPIGQVPNKVKEEIAFGNGNYLQEEAQVAAESSTKRNS